LSRVTAEQPRQSLLAKALTCLVTLIGQSVGEEGQQVAAEVPGNRLDTEVPTRRQAEWRSANLVLATPAGFRVEGLDVAMLVAVLRALS